MRPLKSFAIVLFCLALTGCNLVVMSPSGDIALQQSQLIIYSTILMLIVIVPVILLSLFFAYRYRASNKEASYEPDWDHSTSLEIVVWSVPMAIILCLAGLTWVATHRLNPYDPVKRISAEQPVSPEVEPLIIQVAAMDWKWLFLYPEQNIATVNEVAAVVDRPIEFQLTSTTVMNSFYIPALAGMIYAMTGMQTELNAVINEEGEYEGFASNYNGSGFSKMRFTFHGMTADAFDSWAAEVAASDQMLDPAEVVHLNEPSIAHPVTYYQLPDPSLWDLIVSQCFDENDFCNHNMMLVDALGGGGMDGLIKRQMVKGICTAEDITPLMALLKDAQRPLEPQLREILLAPKPDAGTSEN